MRLCHDAVCLPVHYTLEGCKFFTLSVFFGGYDGRMWARGCISWNEDVPRLRSWILNIACVVHTVLCRVMRFYDNEN